MFTCLVKKFKEYQGSHVSWAGPEYATSANVMPSFSWERSAIEDFC
jgi:hypothetical protein